MKTQLSLFFHTENDAVLGIFDYQNGSVTKTMRTTDDKDCYFSEYSNNNCIKMFESHSELTKNDFLLFRARKNKYVINPEKEGKFENYNKQYILNENDIIKFGRKKYEVIKLNIPHRKPPDLVSNSLSIINEKYGQIFDISLNKNQFCNKIISNNNNDTQEINEINTNETNAVKDFGFDQEEDCRFCFASYSTKENPKVKICNCNTYIHYNCLKKFLRSFINVSESPSGNVISYKSKRFNCLICEEPFPLRFRIKFDDGEIKEYYLIDGLALPDETNYLILESLTYIREKRNLKNIFVVKLSKEEVVIGRHEKNDIVDCDITISRFHSRIKFNEDTGEVSLISIGKYGVLILVKDNLQLINDDKIYLQVGKSFVKIKQNEINI